MRLFVADMEVFKHDWIGVFKDTKTGEYAVFHNDNNALRDFVTNEKLINTFNGKAYDSGVLRAICTGADNEVIKDLNDFIMVGNWMWQHWWIKNNKFYDLNIVDLRDDMYDGLSLKAIEGHLGLPIVETSVPFDIDRPLTPSEVKEVIHYCKADVDATEGVLRLRKDYLKTKADLGRRKGIPIERALSMTNAKLTAAYLDAKAMVRNDEREYRYPDNLDLSKIPTVVIDFFNKMADPLISDDDLFKSSVEFGLGGMVAKVGFGGIHSALNSYQGQASERRLIVNFDVASLYPSLMIRNGYTSRSMANPALYEAIYHERLRAKKTGDKLTSDALKLVLNTTYGCMLNPHNDLYDPLMGRSVCITGQLYMLELVQNYLEQCKTIKLIQTNTDGVMFEIDVDELPLVYAINEKWMSEKQLILEEDRISKIVQKDVNNYLVVFENGYTLTKGAYLSYGLAPVGSFNINNNGVVIAKALIEFFKDGTPVEETIANNNDIFDYQLIAKAGRTYSKIEHAVGFGFKEMQKVNRVYATKDTNFGSLYKTHVKTGNRELIPNLPDHCIVDNENHLKITDIDKSWYILQAQKKIQDYLEKEVVTVFEENQYVKLNDLIKVKGIGKVVVERIREECEIVTMPTMTTGAIKADQISIGEVASKPDRQQNIDEILNELF